jgi:hypothetical protein
VFVIVILLLVASVFPLVGQARADTPGISAVRTILGRLNELHDQGAIDAASEFFDSLSIEEQTAVVSANQTVEIGAGQRDSASLLDNSLLLSSGCYGPYTEYIYGKNALSIVVWKFYHQIQLCANGSAVTDAWCSSWASNVSWGYTWQGHNVYCQVTYGGLGYTSIKYFSRGIFKGCVEWWCQTYQPWIAQQGDYYGNYWVWWG